MWHSALAKKRCWKGQLLLESKLAAFAGRLLSSRPPQRTHAQPLNHVSAPSFDFKLIIILGIETYSMWTQIKLSLFSVLNPIKHNHTCTISYFVNTQSNGNCLFMWCFSLQWRDWTQSCFFANSSIPPFKINWISSASARSYFQKMPLIYSKQKKRVKSTRWALLTVESFLAFIIMKTCLTLSI